MTTKIGKFPIVFELGASFKTPTTFSSVRLEKDLDLEDEQLFRKPLRPSADPILGKHVLGVLGCGVLASVRGQGVGLNYLKSASRSRIDSIVSMLELRGDADTGERLLRYWTQEQETDHE